MSDGTPPPPAGSNEQPTPAPPPSSPYGENAPPSPPPPGIGRRPGGLLDRFVARLIDSVILVVVTLIIDAVLLVGILGLQGANAFGSMGANFAAAAVSAVIGTVINLGYFGLMESGQGKTIGKMVMSLHVEGPTGGNPTFVEAVKRNIWLGLPILGVVPYVGGFIGSIGELIAVILIAVQINGDPERRPWTDKFADTRVVKEG